MKFVITAGHDDADPGNTWGGKTEASLMKGLRDQVAAILIAQGHEVLTDGGPTANWPLSKAMTLIAKSDLAVELHTNASSDPTSKGVEVVAPYTHVLLAKNLAKEIGQVLGIPTRREAGFYSPDQFFRDRKFHPGFVRLGGVIVETFFQSNPVELKTYQERETLVAKAIAGAMVKSLS